MDRRNEMLNRATLSAQAINLRRPVGAAGHVRDARNASSIPRYNILRREKEMAAVCKPACTFERTDAGSHDKTHFFAHAQVFVDLFYFFICARAGTLFLARAFHIRSRPPQLFFFRETAIVESGKGGEKSAACLSVCLFPSLCCHM
jgi:hypothetical protein